TEMRHSQLRVTGMGRHHQRETDGRFPEQKRIILQRCLTQRLQAMPASEIHVFMLLANGKDAPVPVSAAMMLCPMLQAAAYQVEGVAGNLRPSIDEQDLLLFLHTQIVCKGPQGRVHS